MTTRAIYEAIRAIDGPAVLATVIRVEGSAYRHEGAKMLIPAQGLPVGMLSGGCLEADVRDQVQPLMAGGSPKLLTYDMRAEEAELWGLNMGCNGLIEILAEPVGAEVMAAAHEYLAGRPCTLVVVAAEQEALGRRLLVRHDGTAMGSLGSGWLDALAQAEAGRARKPRLLMLGPVQVFIEPVAPPPLLWIAGAGTGAQPLVAAAAAAGWRVRVVDRRAANADPARYPQAEEVLQIGPEAFADRAGEGAFAVFMHHHFDHDRDYLTALLAKAPRYCGVLGPLRRTLQLLGADALPPCVYSPVGLNLGGEGPEAIAVSIVAELQAVLHGRGGGHLRGTALPLR